MSADTRQAAADDAARDSLADNIERTVDKTALRKVRNLVDELEGEQSFFQRQQKWVMIGGAVMLLSVLAGVTLRKSTEVPDAERLACEQREWQSAHSAAVTALRHRHPELTHVEIQRRIESQREELMLQSRKACASVAKR